MRAAVEISLVKDVDALSALAPEWMELWRGAPDTTPFQSPMWLLPWWRHFGSNELHVITVRDRGRLEALAPLYIIREDDESLGLLLGTGISDYLDVVTIGDHGNAIVTALAGVDCQVWDLQQLRPSSPLLQAELPNGWSDTVEEQDACPVLSLEEDLTSTHFRKKLRYYRRSLERVGEVLIEEATAANLDSLLTALFELHAARWQRRGMSGMLADDVVQEFHRHVSRAMLDAGALRMYGIRVGERIVAVFYGFASGDTVYYYLSGYDPDLEKLSPGTLIVAHAIEQAARDGARTFDFLRGAEDYKYTWGAKDRVNRRRALCPPPR
jgi:CelD/BcsL family acetyltransferase involved in cellulose biosynthesis